MGIACGVWNGSGHRLRIKASKGRGGRSGDSKDRATGKGSVGRERCSKRWKRPGKQGETNGMGGSTKNSASIPTTSWQGQTHRATSYPSNHATSIPWEIRKHQVIGEINIEIAYVTTDTDKSRTAPSIQSITVKSGTVWLAHEDTRYVDRSTTYMLSDERDDVRKTRGQGNAPHAFVR